MNQNARLGDEQRTHVLKWLRQNGIDGNDITADALTTLNGDQLTTECFVRNAEGRIQVATTDDTVARTRRTFTITVPPTDVVSEWLKPYCEACGR